MNSLLRWAGSKKRIAPIIQGLWAEGSYTRYVEPFAGSACVFFQLEPSNAIIADLNSELIQMYCALRDSVEEIIALLALLTPADRATYDTLRSIDLASLNTPQRAARFLYLNRYCFNGLYRTNRKGEFNVPFGGNRTGRLPSAENFRRAAALLSHCHLLCGDFRQTLKSVRPGDFVYMDPPYGVAKKRTFSEYMGFEFDKNAISSLREDMQRLHQEGIYFVVSYEASDEGMQLAEGFDIRRVVVPRNIAGFAGHRRLQEEYVITPKQSMIFGGAHGHI